MFFIKHIQKKKVAIINGTRSHCKMNTVIAESFKSQAV